jgi:hypothetical protein
MAVIAPIGRLLALAMTVAALVVAGGASVRPF